MKRIVLWMLMLAALSGSLAACNVPVQSSDESKADNTFRGGGY